MKFLQIKIGQQFIHQGQTYVKSSPLVATLYGTQKQKLFNRATAVTLPEAVTAPTSGAPQAAQSEAEKIKLYFEQFHQTCCEIIERQALKKERAAALQLLESARQRFLAQVDAIKEGE